MAASWLDACRASIEMMKATQDACDPELQSKTEQHATTTLTQKLQQVGSLKPEDIAELGRLAKEAELPSGWGKDLLRAAAQRKLDLSIEAKPEKDRGEKQGQSCPWFQNYLPEHIWVTLLEPSTPMQISLRLLDEHAAQLGLYYADEAFHAYVVGLAAVTKRGETEKPMVFLWLDESKRNLSRCRPAALDKGTLCWQFPSSPLVFRHNFTSFYERAFNNAPPIECPLNSTQTAQYLKSIPQRKSYGTSPSKVPMCSPLDTGTALVTWQGAPPRRNLSYGPSGSADNDPFGATDALARGASGSADGTDKGAGGSADARRPTEMPHFETNEERDLALRLGSVVLRAVRKGSFGGNEIEDISRLTGKKVRRDLIFGSPLPKRETLALTDLGEAEAQPDPRTSTKGKDYDVGAVDADLDRLMEGKGPRGPMKAMKTIKAMRDMIAMKAMEHEEDAEHSDESSSELDESEDAEAKPAKPMKRKVKAMKSKAKPAKPVKATKTKATTVKKGSLKCPHTLAAMRKTPPLWYGESAVYFDIRGGRIRVYGKRGDKVEHTHVKITKETVLKQWARVKAVLLELNP